MRKNWHETAWDDYVDAQFQDRKTLNRINALLKSITERLRGDWKRRAVARQLVGLVERKDQREGQAHLPDQRRHY